MTFKSDQITTVTGATTAIAATLASSGIAPEWLTLFAAIAHILTSYYTNK